LILPPETVFAELYLPFGVISPILSFLLTIEVIADSGVSFDADNSPPHFCAVLVSSLLN